MAAGARKEVLVSMPTLSDDGLIVATTTQQQNPTLNKILQMAGIALGWN
jgi:hypothetical protein